MRAKRKRSCPPHKRTSPAWITDLREARSHLSHAEAKLARVRAEFDELNKYAERGGEGEAERAERSTIAQARQDIVARREAQARQTRESPKRIDQALGALPAAFDATPGSRTRTRAMEGGQKACEDADKAFVHALALGGERTWVNEALTRAIALYLAQNAGRRYQTLFADESDGSLDPERTRCCPP